MRSLLTNMGDRYLLTLNCDWCGKANIDVDYAESSDQTDFKCKFCGEENEIKMGFMAFRKRKIKKWNKKK